MRIKLLVVAVLAAVACTGVMASTALANPFISIWTAKYYLRKTERRAQARVPTTSASDPHPRLLPHQRQRRQLWRDHGVDVRDVRLARRGLHDPEQLRALPRQPGHLLLAR